MSRIRSRIRSRVFGAFLVALATLAALAAARVGTQGGHAAVSADVRASEAVEPMLATAERVFKQTAPFDEVAPGAYAAAVASAKKKPKAGNRWTPVGGPALYADHPDYAGTDPALGSGPSMLGWKKLSGRLTDFAADPANPQHLVASTAAGGVWETTNGGSSWQAIADSLPTQAMGAVAYSSAEGGTIIAGTGDSAVGGVITPSGLGVYRTTNGGRGWTKAAGVPDGLVTFEIALDAKNPTVSYVATNKGLYRSTDNGVTYTNVALPVPKVTKDSAGTLVRVDNGCAGNTTDPACTYATVVTDVVVHPDSGSVLAAVGWVYGQTITKAGIMQAPQNGIYVSPTGAAGSFSFVDSGTTSSLKNGFAPVPVVGRTTLAVASGPGQNHNYVYALVQDATKLQSCLDLSLNVPICTATGGEALAAATFLDGGYVSKDFGRTWTKMLTHEQLRAPGTGSALELGLLGVGPGVQSWYNNWIAVDPTQADPLTGAPTRVAFGLEEIWENSPQTPVVGPANWRVIGRYWNACALLIAGTQCSGTSSPIPGTTTHPDQHAGLFVPDGKGGVTLYAGNDGGAYKQSVSAGSDFSNDRWGDSINNGIHTLQPYDVNLAKDGTIVAGLQDNGMMKVTPNSGDPSTYRQDMIYGGDGFFAAIDPDHSNRIVEEYTYGAISGSTDGGKTWTSNSPSWGGSSSDALFATPFELDPTDANRITAGGRWVSQSDIPYGKCYPNDELAVYRPCPLVTVTWEDVYDLGTVPGTTTPRKSTAVDMRGDIAYAGFCGPCSIFTLATGFESGIVTNAGSSDAKFMSAAGWHEAKATGLPERYITSVRMDRSDATGKTIFVTLGGYSSHWVPPGAQGENISRVGTGHVFVSHDAGETFTDVSGDLPDAPADWVLARNGRLIVGTDVGVFISTDLTGGAYSRLGDLAAVPVVTLREDPANPDRVVAATFGRGIYQYIFK